MLEYKHDLSYLVQDFQNEEKRPDDIDLVVCWKMGNRWSEDFECTSYLLRDNLSHRDYHGLTHRLYSNTSRMDVIVLSELILHLEDFDKSQTFQIEAYGDHD